MKLLIAFTLLLPTATMAVTMTNHPNRRNNHLQIQRIIAVNPARYPEIALLHQQLDINSFLSQFHEPRSNAEILDHLTTAGADYKISPNKLMSELVALGVIRHLPRTSNIPITLRQPTLSH